MKAVKNLSKKVISVAIILIIIFTTSVTAFATDYTRAGRLIQHLSVRLRVKLLHIRKSALLKARGALPEKIPF